MKHLPGVVLPILAALSLVNGALGSPFVPLAWQRVVESGPHQGIRKHVGWVRDTNGDFIDDEFDTLAPGEETQVIVELNECFGSFEDYEEYFRPYGVMVYRGALVAYVILERVPKEKLQALADDPMVAALEYPRPAHLSLDTSTRVVRARASKTHGNNAFPKLQGAGDGSGVTIAIVDTGVDDQHGAFTGKSVDGCNALTNPLTPGNPDDDYVYIAMGADLTCNTTAGLGDVPGNPQPPFSPDSPCVLPGTDGELDTTAHPWDEERRVFHGTHVAGIALGGPAAGAGNTRNPDDGSTPNNGRGMAPGASLLDVKVFDAAGRMPTGAALRALDWVFIDGRADVVNMSFNWATPSDGTSVLSKMVDALVARDIAVAVSVGNHGGHLIGCPADSEFAMTVAWADDHGTVSTSDDTIHANSRFGPRMDYNKNNVTVGMLKPDIAAPGTDIMSAMGNNTTDDYHLLSGSSMAAPHVAGAMALLIDLGRNMTPPRHIPPGTLKDLLKRTADRSMPSHIPMDATVDPYYDDHWGYGLLDVFKAADQLNKGIADISFPAAIGPHPQYPNVRRCLIKGGKASYENDFDIRLDKYPPVVNKLNTIYVDIENRSTAKAENVRVSVGVIDFGVGGQVYDGNSVTVKEVPAKDPTTLKPGKKTVEFKWRPQSVNHQCIQATIDYGLDTDFSNNLTQRNIKKVSTSSPAQSSFVVRNPLHERATIMLEPRLDPVTQSNFSIEMSARQFDMEPEDCPQRVDIQFFPNQELPPGTTGRVDINATAYSESHPEGIELTGVVFYITTPRLGEAERVAAFAFGSRQLECPTFNEPAVNYTMVHHATPEAVQYDPDRGWGYEVLYPTDSPYGNRGGYGQFGPFDDSPNNRNKFPDVCPEELYDSFIGAKDFTNECSGATIGDPDTPCAHVMPPEGIIFRVDVPNGLYRFVGAFGDADNVHAHRILAEDGGSGGPQNTGPNHVVLVSNFDQAQQTIGEADAVKLGEAVYARVGFDGKIPPPGDGVFPSPQFVNMDRNGFATEGPPSSPILEVTQGYIRIHQLQANSNDGPGGLRDGNGGDIVVLELWKIELPEPVCPTELVGVDIGGPEPPGSIDLCGGSCRWAITAGGADIWGTADQFYYAYAADDPTVIGDFTAVVRVKSMEPYDTAHEWAKAGIMARQNLEPGSPNVMVLRSLKNGVTLQNRSQPNEQSSSIHMDGDYGSDDTVWLRLDRVGDTFTGSYAIGGATPPEVWIASASYEVALGPDISLGLATTSHEQGVPIDAAYSDFCIGPYLGPLVLVDPELPDSPVGGDGYMSIREVIDNEAIGDQDACYASLNSGAGTIVDYTASVLNVQDSGGNGNYGNDNAFGVVTVGHWGQGAVDDLSLIARGTIRIPPDQGGIWTFGVNSDDGFTLQFPGQNFLIGENGLIMNFESGAALRFYGGRGVADTLGVIELPSGDHPFLLTYHEGGGDAAVEFFAAKGAHTSFDPDVFRLVGHKSIGSVPIPGFCNEVAMAASRPGVWGQIDSIQDAMDAVAQGEAHGTNSQAMVPIVNHSDPDDGAADPDVSGSFGADLAFPNDQPGDDDDFAVMVEGLLDIPAAGTYQIGFNSDDGAGIQIFGHSWKSIVPGSDATAVIAGDTGDWLITDALTGWSWTAGEIEFAAPGCYEFRAVMFERGGGSFFELFGRGISPTTGKADPIWHLLETGGAGMMQDADGLQLVAHPVAYWKLDEGQGTIARDCSGYGNDGTLLNDPCWVAAIPINIPGIALQFDGIDDYVDCGTFNPSEATGQITVAVWAKWNGLTGQYQGVIGKRDTWAAHDMMWQIECNRDTGVVKAQREGIADIQDPWWVLPIEAYEHVAFTFDGTTGTLYRNGGAVASGAYSFGTDPDAAVVFGACQANGGNPFNGALDDVRIYNRALSPEEIAGLVSPGECFPSMYPAYDDWLALGKPDCWCWPYHCDGDADGVDSGFPFRYRVFIGDLALIVDNWQKKIADVTLSPCADIDHKDSGFPFYYRVSTSDLAIIVENWMKKSEELPGNCPRQE
jgi:subtilisin family serine protease